MCEEVHFSKVVDLEACSQQLYCTKNTVLSPPCSCHVLTQVPLSSFGKSLPGWGHSPHPCFQHLLEFPLPSFFNSN